VTTWVLLRGLMRESRHWGEFPQRFSDGVGRANVVPVDIPGNGRLYQLPSASNIPETLGAVRGQLKDLGHVPPYSVLALSMGAMVAVSWYERHPGELERLVLINTSLAPFSPFYRRLRPENYARLLGTLLFRSIAKREELILDITSNVCNRNSANSILKHWLEIAAQCPVARINIVRQLFAAATFRAGQGTPDIPILLLASKHDRLVDSRCSHDLAGHWNCPVVVHPVAGHDLPLDDPDWVVLQCRQWLESIAHHQEKCVDC
jgi:pimeloyl-ACP methyl ester carboxylesterase